jgi:type I restriction enzyme S subunit
MNNSFCFKTKLPKKLGKRIDCKYHNPKTINEIEKLENYQASNRKIEKLGKIAVIKGGKRLPKGHIFFKTDYDDIPYIRAIDIKHGKVDIENSEKINYEVHKKIEKYRLYKGDIVITIVGTIGESGILEDNVEICNFTENIARVSSKDENISNIFLYYFLNSDLGKVQTHRLSVGSLQDKLSLKNCRNINVLLPYNTKTKKFDINEQYRIINEASVYNKKAEENLKYYHNKIKEIKSYIPQKLKIRLPTESKKEQIFPYVLSKNFSDRIDALFNNPYRDALIFELKKYPYKKLGKIITIEKAGEILPSEFYNLIDLDDISEDLGEVINIKEVPNLGSRKTLFRKGELLISKLQPDKGKIILVDHKTDSCVGSSELVPLKLVSEDVLLEYLWIILRSDYVLKQWKYEITGSSRERIGKTELKNTIIPIPNKDIQQEIIKETKEKIEQAKYFLKEYKDNRQKAKQVFLKLVS